MLTFKQYVAEITDVIHRTSGFDPDLQAKILATLVFLLSLSILRYVILRIVWRRTEDVHVRYLWRKSISYIVTALGLLFIVRLWFSGFKDLGTFLGLVSAGLAIALKDPLTDIAGWMFILWRKPFGIGDRIQIGAHAGDVIDIRLFQFTLLEIGNWVDADQSTGRVIHIPNEKVFMEALANYSKGFQFIWNEIAVLVTFESDWKKAKEILARIVARHAEHLTQEAQEKVKKASQKFMIFYTQLTPIVYTDVKDSGVNLTIRYLTDPRKRRGSTQNIWEDILTEFAEHKDIDFAYPTTRFYNNLNEGKEAGNSGLPSQQRVDHLDNREAKNST
ncbi:mechanosensitive ion channel family protein [bacterium]|nr:mechanosensitive ion channel family protein [bacterium]MBU1881537.1 mechanosensitive ion channel family protein [bacterium]